MVFKKISNYWLCQVGGWSAYFLLCTLLSLSFDIKVPSNLYTQYLLLVVEGLIVTHIMRTIIKMNHFLDLPIRTQIIYFLVTTVLFSLLYTAGVIMISDLLHLSSAEYMKFTLFQRLIYNWATIFPILLVWSLLYFLYHYLDMTLKEQRAKAKLENMVKELELKTIKAHINPHFIFNALNSIRALVDENPERARTAITELSNLLRSSMQSEKLETTPLERELNIVKDYLALEHIRFEDRLQVEYDIDEDTLDQPIPPMMLQTLVENAIKHGISRILSGGLIRIISAFRADHYELTVENTGKLKGEDSERQEGFGISSTHNRLNILFGKEANFQIRELGNNMVQARVIMPVRGL